MKQQLQLLVIMTAASSITHANEKELPTPLHKAAQSYRYNPVFIIEKIQESQGKIGQYLITKNDKGETPLALAIRWKNWDDDQGRIYGTEHRRENFAYNILSKLENAYMAELLQRYTRDPELHAAKLGIEEAISDSKRRTELCTVHTQCQEYVRRF